LRRLFLFFYLALDEIADFFVGEDTLLEPL
jgi:hypothetical protein